MRRTAAIVLSPSLVVSEANMVTRTLHQFNRRVVDSKQTTNRVRIFSPFALIAALAFSTSAVYSSSSIFLSTDSMISNHFNLCIQFFDLIIPFLHRRLTNIKTSFWSTSSTFLSQNQTQSRDACTFHGTTRSRQISYRLIYYFAVQSHD